MTTSNTNSAATTNGSEIAKTTRKDLFLVDARNLRIIEGFNTRTIYREIEELAESILENGVLMPLKGYKEGDLYYVTDGHRRMMAIEIANKKSPEPIKVPFIVERKKSLGDMMFNIVICNDGHALTPLELGETYKKIESYGYNINEIAKKTGKSYAHVYELVNLANAPKAIKNMIVDGEISASLAMNVTRDNNEADSVKILTDAVTKAKSEGKDKATKKDVVIKEKAPKKVVLNEDEKAIVNSAKYINSIVDEDDKNETLDMFCNVLSIALGKTSDTIQKLINDKLVELNEVEA